MKAGKSPRKCWLTTVPVTEEITIGENWATPKSPRITSTANRAPAIGALKVAAIPAAAPHPTSVRRRCSSMRSHWPIVEPMAEPIYTIGPSRPTEPPEPMQMPDANSLAIITRGLIRPPRRATASMTSGTPCPLTSRANR